MKSLGFVALLVLSVVFAIPLGMLGLPSASLFTGVVLGMIVALRVNKSFEVQRSVVAGSYAAIGVVTAVSMDLDSLVGLPKFWPFVVIIVLTTIVLSGFSGIILARFTDVDRKTGLLSMLAGGAAGLTAMSRELGADDRVVAVAQYARLLVVVTTLPIIAPLISGGTTAWSSGDPGALLSVNVDSLVSLAIALVIIVLGVILAKATKIPAGALLIPMVLAISFVAVSGYVWQLPELFSLVAFALVGLSVGLRFNKATLGPLKRILPLGGALTALLLLVTFLVSKSLAGIFGISPLTAYLASSPGGIYSVVAFAAAASDQPEIVVLTQTVRLILVLALAPVFVWIIKKWLHDDE